MQKFFSHRSSWCNSGGNRGRARPGRLPTASYYYYYCYCYYYYCYSSYYYYYFYYLKVNIAKIF